MPGYIINPNIQDQHRILLLSRSCQRSGKRLLYIHYILQTRQYLQLLRQRRLSIKLFRKGIPQSHGYILFPLPFGATGENDHRGSVRVFP